MKILYLIHQFYPEYYTGTEKIILSLAKMMQKYGHNVKVITYSFYDPSFYDRRIGGIAIKEFIYEGVPVLAFRYRNIPENIHYALENTELSEVADDLIRREKPDIVHVGHSMRVGELVKAVRNLSIPYIITLTDFFLMCPKYTLVRSNGSLCGGPEAGQACREHCPEVTSEANPKRFGIAREFLNEAEVVAAPSLFLLKLFEREFGKLKITLVQYGLAFEH